MMFEVLIRQHIHDNACILADSGSKPKLETVAGKGKVKRTPSSTTAFVVDFIFCKQKIMSALLFQLTVSNCCLLLELTEQFSISACCCLFFHVKAERTLCKTRFLLCIRCYHKAPYTIMLKRKCYFQESLVKDVLEKMTFGDVICCFDA